MIVQTLARLSSTGSVTNRIRGKRLRLPSPQKLQGSRFKGRQASLRIRVAPPSF